MKKVTKQDIEQKLRIPLFCNWDGCAIHIGDEYVTEVEGSQKPHLRFPNRDGTIRMHARHLSSSQMMAHIPKRHRHGSSS